MEEERTASKLTRRRLIKRLGMGTAVAWLAPVVTSLGSKAGAAGCCACDGIDCTCNWVCGGTLEQCGTGCGTFGAGYCSRNTEEECYCWEDSFCSEVSDCTQSSDCPSGYSCIPNTCCGTAKCLPACGLGPKSRRRHGKLSSGRVR